MKYAIILPDGAADEPVEQLGGQTPLRAAATPAIDWIATNGRQGCVRTVPRGFQPASDVATLSLFGYDPASYHTGRAPLEAAARDVHVGPNEIVFRCNFVTIVDGVMCDFTAGHISQAEAERLIDVLNQHVADSGCRFSAGMSYRNLMVATDLDADGLTCSPPHDFPGEPVADRLPKGKGAEKVNEIMRRAEAFLAHHDVNHVRRDLGENLATHIWLWGQGKPRTFDSFESRFGLRCAVIAAVDLVRGVAKCAGMTLIDVDGATGYLDTNYAAKGAAALEALHDFDLVIVHIEAPGEAGHTGDVDAKVTAIERIDERIVAPVLGALRHRDHWKILIAPDQPTPVERRIHSAAPPPFCLAGDAVHSVMRRPFCEKAGAESDLQIARGHELMEYFLKR